jgi:hypothetical protein
MAAKAAKAAKAGKAYEGRLREGLERRLTPELKQQEALLKHLSCLEQEAGADLATAGSYGKVIAEAPRRAAAARLPKLGF